MSESSALFDNAFQELQQARAKMWQHPLLRKAQERLEERLADLKEACPYKLSCFELQHTADLPETLSQEYRALPENGLFLGVLAGGNSLHELRESLMKAESELTGGANPRVAPMMDLQTLNRLLPAAGFAHTVTDQESLTLVYEDIFALMHELRAGGWSNSLTARSRSFAPRCLFERAGDIYKEHFTAPSGGIMATIDLFYLHGWKEPTS
ncbi:MAG TPA: hypothetical protein DD400_03910 [Rhodospirillaceae bacterium]|nr:hypothetical protein [Rhodospirillaceae bacterium]